VRFGLIALVFAICLAASAAPPARAGDESDSPPSRVTLHLKWRHQFQFAGYYAAIAKGYFADEGIEVVLREGLPGDDTAALVSSGQADFAIGSSSVLLGYAHGLPVVAVAAIFQHSPLVLLVRRGSGLDHPQALGGHRVMLGGVGDKGDPEILAMLAGEGVTKHPIERLRHSGDTADLLSGRVDAMSAYLTNEVITLRPAGIDVIRPRQYGVDFYGDVLVTSRALATNRPELARGMLRATRRGWDYAMAHPEEIADLILARYAPEQNRDFLLDQAAVMRELILPDLVEIGHMSRGRWRHIGETFAAAGMIDPDTTLDGFLFSDIEEAMRARANRWIEGAILVGLGGLAMALLLCAFVARLRALVRRRTHELAASEERFRTIFDSVNDAILLVGPDDGAVLDVNQRTCELFGYPREEMARLTITDLGLTGTGHPRRFDPAWWRAKAGCGRMHLLEWRARGKDGHAFWVEASLRQASVGGAPLFLVVARDISARREVEERLRQTIEDLVASNSDLERFAYISSHDLQTPLRNVVSYAQLLARRYRGRLDADADEFIGFIVDNTRHMSELINDLLDYTRVGRPALPLVPVEVKRALGQALAALRPDLEAADANFQIGEMPRVMADESQMISLFQNLIGNALKYRHPNRRPEIVIEAAPHLGTMWCIAVRDNGIGIEKQYFAKIFEIFQRLHPDHKSTGTGIGLALCQRIVHRFGGEIWVESVPEVGSTFFFTVEAAPVA